MKKEQMDRLIREMEVDGTTYLGTAYSPRVKEVLKELAAIRRVDRRYNMSISATTIDTMLWHIQRELMHRYGCDRAARDIAPLRWYIDTGRASADFLRSLFAAKPFMVARKLHMGGSDEEVIARVKSYIGI